MRVSTRGLAAAMMCWILLAPAAARPHAPQPQDELAAMLKITWTRGPNLPQGFQDSDGGLIGSTLITACGFCSGVEVDNAKKPGIYPRGFLTRSWALDLESMPQRWRALPDFPGAARQALFSAVVDEKLYLWGGFSYAAPFCYADGWRVSRQGDGWKWETLPPLPRPLAAAAACTVGSTIYVFGGTDYDSEGYFTESDRAGAFARLGARLIYIDTRDLRGGWRELPQCPGTPRFAHTMQAIGEDLFVIGGATGGRTRTVVDNWRFRTATQQWTRLRDLPVSSGNFPRSTNLVFGQRYVILVGGHQYDEVANPDGTWRPRYGQASRRNPGSGLHNDVFVYDTYTDHFGTADKLPIDNNLPMAVVRRDEIFLIGGETGGGVVEGEYYGHHPDLLLCGKIEALEP
jgi:N-acetylneuraminic acid mutarotase